MHEHGRGTSLFAGSSNNDNSKKYFIVIVNLKSVNHLRERKGLLNITLRCALVVPFPVSVSVSVLIGEFRMILVAEGRRTLSLLEGVISTLPFVVLNSSTLDSASCSVTSLTLYLILSFVFISMIQ